MGEDLISKKEILELTGISYGQLYRWKRKNLIPEEWFIKKSSFTGQETYFPKDKILERIDKIKDMKDDMSLDDLANMFSPQLKEVLLTKDEVTERNIVSQTTMAIYDSFHKDNKTFNFEKVLFVSVIEKFLQTGDVGIEEGKAVLQTLEENYRNFEGRNFELVLIRKFGIATCFLINVPSEVYLEKGAKIVFRVDMAKCIEEVKIKALN